MKKYNLFLLFAFFLAIVSLKAQTGNAVQIPNLILDRPRDESGTPIGGGIIENPDAPASQQRYKLKTISDAQGTAIPSVGVLVEI